MLSSKKPVARLVNHPDSSRHKSEHSPTQVLSGVCGIAGGLGSQLGTHLCREFVGGIGIQPAAHGQPFGSFVSIPTILIGEHHFHHVVTELSEKRDKIGKKPVVRNRVREASLGSIFRRG